MGDYKGNTMNSVKEDRKMKEQVSKERWEVSAHLLNDLFLQHTAREVYEGEQFLYIEVKTPTGEKERYTGKKKDIAANKAEIFLLEWRLAFVQSCLENEGETYYEES